MNTVFILLNTEQILVFNQISKLEYLIWCWNQFFTKNSRFTHLDGKFCHIFA